MAKKGMSALLHYGGKVYRPTGYRNPRDGELYMAEDGHIKTRFCSPHFYTNPNGPRLTVREYFGTVKTKETNNYE